MTGSAGNAFLGLYLRVLLAREIARSEAGVVTAYSFHPGMVATPGFEGDYSKNLKSMIGATPIAALCDAMPWFSCLCRGPYGAKAHSCPLTSLEGGVSGAYLAAAPVSELHSINGAQTVLCGDQVGETIDPYPALIA